MNTILIRFCFIITSLWLVMPSIAQEQNDTEQTNKRYDLGVDLNKLKNSEQEVLNSDENSKKIAEQIKSFQKTAENLSPSSPEVMKQDQQSIYSELSDRYQKLKKINNAKQINAASAQKAKEKLDDLKQQMEASAGALSKKETQDFATEAYQTNQALDALQQELKKHQEQQKQFEEGLKSATERQETSSEAFKQSTISEPNPQKLEDASRKQQEALKQTDELLSNPSLSEKQKDSLQKVFEHQEKALELMEEHQESGNANDEELEKQIQSEQTLAEKKLKQLTSQPTNSSNKEALSENKEFQLDDIQTENLENQSESSSESNQQQAYDLDDILNKEENNTSESSKQPSPSSGESSQGDSQGQSESSSSSASGSSSGSQGAQSGSSAKNYTNVSRKNSSTSPEVIANPSETPEQIKLRKGKKLSNIKIKNKQNTNYSKPDQDKLEKISPSQNSKPTSKIKSGKLKKLGKPSLEKPEKKDIPPSILFQIEQSKKKSDEESEEEENGEKTTNENAKT